MENFETVEVHKDAIVVGDCIEHNGVAMTVSANNITRCEMFGRKIFGDSYRLGSQKVKLLRYVVP